MLLPRVKETQCTVLIGDSKRSCEAWPVSPLSITSTLVLPRSCQQGASALARVSPSPCTPEPFQHGAPALLLTLLQSVVTPTPPLLSGAREPPAHMVTPSGQLGGTLVVRYSPASLLPALCMGCPPLGRRYGFCRARYALGQSQAAHGWGCQFMVSWVTV